MVPILYASSIPEAREVREGLVPPQELVPFLVMPLIRESKSPESASVVIGVGMKKGQRLSPTS